MTTELEENYQTLVHFSSEGAFLETLFLLKQAAQVALESAYDAKDDDVRSSYFADVRNLVDLMWKMSSRE